MIKLSEYAKMHGLCYRSAYDHFKKGLISGAYQLPTGTIVIPDSYEPQNKTEWVVCYSRVSSSENRDNLNKQAERIVSYCNAKGWKVAEDIREIGSGLNDNRPKLLKVLDSGKATQLVVEHKDRLARFGVNFISRCCKRFGCQLHIVNSTETAKEDLVQDFVSVITSFCARLYGQRRSRRKTEKLIKDLQNDPLH